MLFALDYLIDNGRLSGWETGFEQGCSCVRWTDDNSYSILDANGKPLGWGETKGEAANNARCLLTDRRRIADGVTPAKVC